MEFKGDIDDESETRRFAARHLKARGKKMRKPKRKGSFKPTYRDAAMALKARSKARDSDSDYA